MGIYQAYLLYGNDSKEIVKFKTPDVPMLLVINKICWGWVKMYIPKSFFMISKIICPSVVGRSSR